MKTINSWIKKLKKIQVQEIWRKLLQGTSRSICLKPVIKAIKVKEHFTVWKQFLMGLSHFISKVLISFYYGLFFKNVHIVNSFVSLQSKEQSCLILIIKDLDSLSSGFLCYNATHSMWSCYLSLFTSPCDNRGSGTGTKMLIVWMLLLV